MNPFGRGGGGKPKGDDDDRRTYRDIADEQLIARLEQHEKAGRRLVFTPRIRTWAAAPKTHVAPEDWGAGYLKEPREFEPPLQLIDDLHQCSPQAILRDLYRPVMTVRWHQFEPIEGTEREPFTALADARKARMVSTMPPRVDPATRIVNAYLHWRIGMMAEKWEATLPDDAPRRYTSGIPVFT